MKNRKRTILYLLLLGFFLPSCASGMTILDGSGGAHGVQVISMHVQQKDILLLSWDDNFLQTSRGTLSTTGVKIMDHADVDRRELPRMKKLPIIKFTTQDNQVIQVDIYPPR